jgi:hypothetical protein
MQMSYSRYANKNHDDKKDEFFGDSRMNILRLKSPIEKLNFTDFTISHNSIH